MDLEAMTLLLKLFELSFAVFLWNKHSSGWFWFLRFWVFLFSVNINSIIFWSPSRKKIINTRKILLISSYIVSLQIFKWSILKNVLILARFIQKNESCERWRINYLSSIKEQSIFFMMSEFVLYVFIFSSVQTIWRWLGFLEMSKVLHYFIFTLTCDQSDS